VLTPCSIGPQSLRQTNAARFRKMFPNLPASTKLAPSLERQIAAEAPSFAPRCSRFQRHPSFSSAADSTTSTTVSDTFANHARFARSPRASVSSAAETTTSTTSTAAQRARASRFQPVTPTLTSTSALMARYERQLRDEGLIRPSRFQRTSFSSANGTTTLTHANTMSSSVRHPDPVSHSSALSRGLADISSQAPSTTLPPLSVQQPAQKPATKPARVIQCDPLPGGKFPTTYSGLDYDTSKEV